MSGVAMCVCVCVVGGAGFLPPPVLTGPPDFGLIFTAGITSCFLAGSLGRAWEELRKFWSPRGSMMARAGSLKVVDREHC